MTASDPRPGRRRLARIPRPRGSFRALLVLAIVAVVWAFVWEPGRLLERGYALVLPRWPAQCDGLRVDVVADLHTGSPFNGLDNLDRVVERLQASDADVVLLAGDYVILSVMFGEYIPAERIAPRFARLAAHKPVYAVPTIALTHNPEVFPEIPARAALTVAGHTHGGQLGIPWPGDPPLPARIGGHYLTGHLVERGRHLFVSSGIGTSILPFRFGMPPEISRLRLRSEAAVLSPAPMPATTTARRTAAPPARTTR